VRGWIGWTGENGRNKLKGEERLEGDKERGDKEKFDMREKSV